jgi:protein-S-isoprenylcysteine O-methyltransferase Ste14
MSFRKMRVPLLRVTCGGFIALSLFFGQSAGGNFLEEFALRWVGYLLLVIGLGLRLWAILYVGDKKSHELIATGPYSLCRNPLYVGTAAVTLGTALIFENPAMCLFALAVVIPIHVVVVLAEEKHLGTIFGDAYAQYRRRTPRFLFRVSGYKSAPAISIPIRALRRAAVDAFGVLMIPLLAGLVGLLQGHGILPVLVRWP